MQKWLMETLTGAIIAAFWAMGDWLFDWFFTVERAVVWRAKAEQKVLARIAKNDAWKPTMEWGKTWKANVNEMLRAQCAYYGFTTAVYDAEQVAHG